MKKKLFSLVLALALCLGLTLPVSAVDSDPVAEWNSTNAVKTGLTMFSEKDPTAQRPWYETVYGLKDSAGNIVVPAKYFSLTLLGNDRIDVCQTWVEDNFYDAVAHGVIDLKGNFLLPCSIHHSKIVTNGDGDRTLSVNFKDTYSNVIGKNSTAMYDWNLNQLLPPEYNTISYAGNDSYILGINTGTASLMSAEPSQIGIYKFGKGITIPLQYERITSIGSDQFCVQNHDTYCGAFTGNGEQVLPFSFANVTAFRDNFYVVGLFRNQESFNTIQKQIANDESTFFDGSGMDMTEAPSCVVWGVINQNQLAYSDFTHEHVKFDGANVWLGEWNGEREWYNPFAGTNIQGGFLVKKYSYQIIPISSLNKTGETLTSLIRKSGVAVPNMPSNPIVPDSTAVGGFTDVKSNDYYADAVLWAVEKNITSGTSKTMFSPGATCSKAQILTFLWRANGSPEPTAANPFTDIKPADYFYKAALWAAEKGLVSGSTLGAITDCTRAMTVEYLWKAAGSPTPSAKASFTDVPANADYAQAVAWAVENKITSGTGGGNFSPAATCTRGQIVTFLYRAMGK